ncbi:MAG: DNA-binding protein [Thermoplasmatales archaeon]|jgi:programmed cell death protein 5|nr:DNA-binding protein [Thermoplasmatales archaeon]
MDEELENLRRKKLQELQQQGQLQESLEEQNSQKKELEDRRRMILRGILTTQAKERLGRIKVARPEMAEEIENQLIMLVQGDRLKNKINDEQLRMLLSKIIPKKRDIKIERR